MGRMIIQDDFDGFTRRIGIINSFLTADFSFLIEVENGMHFALKINN